MLQAIIFDVDGTLAETEEVHRAAFNSAFAKAGLDWHWDEACYARLLRVTGGKERIAHFMETTGRAKFAQGETRDLVAKLHAEKSRIYEGLVERRAIALRPGIEPLISAARANNIRLAIATTTSFGNVVALLKSTLGRDATDIFEAIAAGDSVRRKKPAPDIFLSVLEALNLPATACLAIEDSQNGLRAARAAGLTTVVTPSLYTHADAFDDAARVVPTLAGMAGHSGANAGWEIFLALQAIHADATPRP